MRKINLFEYKKLKDTEINDLCRRAESDLSDYYPKVDNIIQNVKQNGDVALKKYSFELDKAFKELNDFKVSRKEFLAAFNTIETDMKEVLEFCSSNVKKFHEAQMPKKKWMIEIHPGVFAGEKVEPIEIVAMYVPRGKGSFPSVAMMTSIPAIVAGVKTPIIFTPPEVDGSVDCATLVAASIAGVKDVYKIGGAQAVAAAAFGTQTIPKCLKIVGPGSPWVAAAKNRLSDFIDTGTPAGPSEAIVLADETAKGKVAALDLLIEAEHGSDSSAYLITNSTKVVEDALSFIPICWKQMSKERVEYSSDVLSGPRGGIILVEEFSQAIDFTNKYAPEHLQIHSMNAENYVEKITNAGEILFGDFSPLSIANFSLGPNNVIPTNAASKTKSPLGVHDFLKSTSIGQINEKGYNKLAPFVYKFAKYEGFDAHANAVSELRIKAMKT